MKKKFRTFTEARKFVQSLKLKNWGEWLDYNKSGKKPNDIPAAPRSYYLNKGWKGWGDFLGTGNIATRDRVYKTFEEARKFVHTLKIKTQREWNAYRISGKKPDDIPSDPKNVYKNKGWEDWGDFLGTGRVANQNRQFRSFTEARKFACSLKLSARKEWREYIKSGKKPDDIPANPYLLYKKEWTTWGDWLGTGNISGMDRHKQFRTFQQARKFVHKLKIKTQIEWNAYRISGKKPDDIPTRPDGTYKKEWTTWGDWFGTGRVANQNRQFRSFTEARKFVRSLKLKNFAEWKQYCKSEEIPDDIPSNPNLAYKEYISVGDWLGTGFIGYQVRSANFAPWPEAKQKMRKLGKEYGLKGFGDWSKFAKTHGKLLAELNLPAAPWMVYTKERVWKRMR